MGGYSRLDLFFKAKKFKTQFDSAKKTVDFTKKVKTADQNSWSKDLRYLDNAISKSAIPNMEKALSFYKDVEKVKLEEPYDITTKYYFKLLKSANQYGAKHIFTDASLVAYRESLKKYDGQLKNKLKSLIIRGSAISKHLDMAIALQKYANLLEKRFMQLAKIPPIVSTANQASWFVLAQDASKYAGLASDCAKYLKKAMKINNAAVKKWQTLVKDNKQWIAFAAKEKLKDKDTLKKNKTAVKPK